MQADSNVIQQGCKKSESLLGFEFVCNFLGNRYSSPTENWGLISIEAEGELYGFLIINSDGTVKEFPIKDYYLHGELNADFNENNDLIFSGLYMDNKPIDLIINLKGDYRISNK